MKENNIKNDFDKRESVRNKAFCNKPFKIDSINVYTPTLEEIFDLEYEYNTYNYYLNLLTVDANMLIDNNKTLDNNDKELIKKFKTLDVLVLNIISNRENNEQEYEVDILNALEFFLCKNNEQIHFIFTGDLAYFYIGNIEENKIIHRDNFEEIKEVIKIQNGIIKDKKESKQYNPFDNNANEIVEKARQRQEILNKKRKKTQINLRDLISIYVSKQKISLSDVWKYNIYQFNDQLNRIQINENYEIQKYLLGNAYAGESIDFEKNTYFKKILIEK